MLLFTPGIRLTDFAESEQWPEDIKRFMDKLCRVSLFCAFACPAFLSVDWQARSYKDWPTGRQTPQLVSMQLECKTTTVLNVKGLGPAQALAALK